jgi:hypothetical protein
MKTKSFPVLALLILIGSGCSSRYGVSMPPELPIRDDTSVAPQLKDKKYTKIMVIPPSGTARGQFDREINFFEREFLKHKLIVISSAITGRVVLEVKGNDGEKKEEGAQGLSDAERALVMAKKTGADAILQIGAFGWTGQKPSRFYHARKDDSPNSVGVIEFREVSLRDFETLDGLKQSYSAQWLEFVGRLVDVQSGEVMASFKYGNSLLWNLPAPYAATLKRKGSAFLTESENYSFSQGSSMKEADDRTIERVVAAIASKIAGR